MGTQSHSAKTWTSCAFTCSGFAMLLVSFIYAVYTRKEAYLLRDGFKSMVSNWNADMVFDLSLQSSPVLPSPQENYYVTEWSSTWPGNIDGCYCWVSNSRKKVSKGLQTRPCSFNETSVGCKDITDSGPQAMNKWKNSQTIYAVRGKGTSFYANYQQISAEGFCPSGYRHCGDKNSKSKGLCIPEKFGACPISDVRNSQPGGYNSLALSTSTLYYSNTSKYNSVCDLVYSQEYTCFIRTHFSTSPGRQVYELLKGDRTSCIEDPTVLSIDEIGETDLLNLNQINHQRMFGFDTSNNWKWKMMAARFIDWSPSCQDTVASISDKTADLETLGKDYFTMFVIYIISFVLSIIAILVQRAAWFTRRGKQYKWFFFGRIMTFILIAPSLIICTAKSGQFLSFFKSIADLECSNSETNDIFAKMAEDIRVKVVSKTVLFMLLGYLGFTVEVITANFDFKCGLLDSSSSFVYPEVTSSVVPTMNPSPPAKELAKQDDQSIVTESKRGQEARFDLFSADPEPEPAKIQIISMEAEGKPKESLFSAEPISADLARPSSVSLAKRGSLSLAHE